MIQTRVCACFQLSAHKQQAARMMQRNMQYSRSGVRTNLLNLRQILHARGTAGLWTRAHATVRIFLGISRSTTVDTRAPSQLTIAASPVNGVQRWFPCAGFKRSGQAMVRLGGLCCTIIIAIIPQKLLLAVIAAKRMR